MKIEEDGSSIRDCLCCAIYAIRQLSTTVLLERENATHMIKLENFKPFAWEVVWEVIENQVTLLCMYPLMFNAHKTVFSFTTPVYLKLIIANSDWNTHTMKLKLDKNYVFFWIYSWAWLIIAFIEWRLRKVMIETKESTN